jgi:hypothetical protein
MSRGLGMMPTRGLDIMRGFRVMAPLIVFGGFLVMTRGVPILFSRLLVLRRSLGGHRLSSHERVGHATPRFLPRHARSLGLHAPGEL